MSDLYDERIRDMKAREYASGIGRFLVNWTAFSEGERNAERLAAYKRKREETSHD